MSVLDRLADLSPERVRPLRRVEYERMAAEGRFEGERVELVKADLYAIAGLVEYWVVNLVDRRIEVHTDAVGGRYTRQMPAQRGEAIRLRAFSDVEIAVSDIVR
ncbi:MAG TPA: Uma2 family endonuclease [Vicinamibacterales bacterium]|nr:Uma2 family endonuclease [Vicinamibacterales bacterium]